VLECSHNQLTYLNMRNGVTEHVEYFNATNNSLTCILVNEEDVAWATENWTHENENIDEGVIFDNDCIPEGNTYVPDDNFEQALIDLGYDDVLDDSVATASIYNVTDLNVPDREISDLTGIEDFTALEMLFCHSNQLTSLDVSNNTALVRLDCGRNQLTSLDVSNNLELEALYCGYNQITSLDLSNHSELLVFDGSYGWLTSLNLKGRHPSEFESIYGVDNPLECVDVLDPTWAFDNWYQLNFDRSVEFAFICGAEDRSVWHVSAGGSNNTGDGTAENPLATIQVAIDVASNGDSVLVGPGMYNENISWINKHLTIIGAGSGQTIIDAQQLDNGVRIQNINNSSLFEGFTIKNGSTVSEDYPWAFGGGICMINSHATLRDIIVEDCISTWAVNLGASSSLFEDVTIRNNDGGGISLGGSGSYPVLKRVTIEGNINGFGMRVYDTGVMMDSSEVVNNPAGGIWYEGVGFNPSVYTNSLFHNNGSENSPFGAIKIMNSGATATFDHCTFYGNQSSTLGSDIYSLGLYFNEDYYGNDITIVNSVFYNEQQSSIYLQPTDYADTLNISYASLLTMESITLDNINHLEIGAGMIYGDPMFCNPENGEYTINVFSPLVDAGSDGEIIGAFGVDCGHEPTITGVWDVPNDQGGRVYLDFNRCVYDQPDELNQLYTVFRLDMIANEPVWVVAASGAAIGDQSYTYEILTLQDSTASGDGLTHFKVVASMNEGIFHSDEMAGYSVDNIAPAVPAGFMMVMGETGPNLSWEPVPDEDIDYYVIDKSAESSFMNDQYGSFNTVELSFIDTDYQIGTTVYYRIYAVDHAGNRGEYSYTLMATSVLGVDNTGTVPEVFTLHQNYPNPFNPTTLIRYDLALSEYVSINIYDLMGHKIKSLVNVNQDPGYRSISWDATNDLGQPVSAGMYIYTIQAGEFRQTKKMVLLK
ncbi:MAG: right-handed parallel beta-helix repeat-containing protein, partial [Candidatus Marinimicrobia bacterium]|nr:right-handed parallel beta-helix repeat-containing protein [Candidatus Neomarinimicrobiota bacterium]